MASIEWWIKGVEKFPLTSDLAPFPMQSQSPYNRFILVYKDSGLSYQWILVQQIKASFPNQELISIPLRDYLTKISRSKWLKHWDVNRKSHFCPTTPDRKYYPEIRCDDVNTCALETRVVTLCVNMSDNHSFQIKRSRGWMHRVSSLQAYNFIEIQDLYMYLPEI